MRKKHTRAMRKRAKRAVHSRSVGWKAMESLDLKTETRRHISGSVQIAMALVFFLVIRGNAGLVGSAVNDLLTFLFGSGAIVLPIALLLSGLLHLFGKEDHIRLRSTFGLALCLVAVLGYMHIQVPFQLINELRSELGGAIGFMVAFPLLAFTSLPVAYVVISALFLVGLFVTFEMGPHELITLFKAGLRRGEMDGGDREEKEGGRTRREDFLEEGMQRGEKETGKGKPLDSPLDHRTGSPDKAQERKRRREEPTMHIVRPVFVKEELEKKKLHPEEKTFTSNAVSTKKEEKTDEMEMADVRFTDWEFPSLDCLDDARSKVMVDDATLKLQAKLIEQKLKEFDIVVTMREAHPGPTVTQFALEPAEGVKLSRIGNLKSDLALALAAPSLRIEAPIPGKSLVGIEMPNSKRTTVHLREMLESPEFRESESPLSLPFGRDVSGKAIVEDLAEMPHLLVAGATGSGKSVCMNTFLLSLLYQNAPHELKFILIDPKRVELTLYDGIPHLLTPVITESEKALKALRWAVAEMGRRLARFSEIGARNLAEYNEKTEEEKHMPRIVIVIDELADLMMRQFRRDTELMITRIAQIARATGMHLIVATQRPSVDVITGIIKANIPSRIAFRTVSSIDSRTIIDSIGAEDLLGKGDMLHINASTPVPMRVQGVFVSSKESERVTNQVKISGGGAITAQIPLGREEESASGLSTDIDENGEGERGVTAHAEAGIDLDASDDGGDDLTFEAIELVRHSRKASASLLQRHLKVGYARAARLLDILEEKGVVGPVDGAKPRKVYVDTV